MSTSKKATIYVDAEDDITAVVEHVKNANEPIVALVIPKRAEVFSSLVNMKLLKRAAAQAKKRTVLITDNASITKLAGSIGMYVAPTLRSKPAIPEAPKPKTSKKSAKKAEPEQEAGLDTTEPAVMPVAATDVAKKVTDKAKKAKSKIKVPNFDAFKLRVALIVVALLAIPVLWFIGFRVLPSATIKITTNATNIPANLELTTTTNLEQLDTENLVIPISQEENKQQYSEAFEATGEKQVGGQASGLMTISNCKTDDTAATIPAGTVFKSGNLSFASGVAVELEPGNFTGGGSCKSSGGHVKTITVTAVEPGDQYNLSSRSYTIESVSSEITAFGGDMSGGSNEIVKVVSQNDIDSALQRLRAEQDTAAVRDQLVNALQTAGFVPIVDSFESNEAEPLSSAEVDEETTGGNVSLNVTYVMIGVRETDVLALLLPVLETGAGDKQVIDSGIAAARYKSTKLSAGGYNLEISTTGIAGLVLEEDQVFEDIKGKEADVAASELRDRDGITSVEVSSSPVWNSSIPNNRNKVTIEINGQ